MLICILTARPEAAEYYTSTLREMGVEGIVVTRDVDELFAALTSKYVSGVAADIPSLVRASEHGKQLISDISEIFPLLRMNWAPGKELRAMGNRFVAPNEPPLKAFVMACRHFHPRSMRKQERVERVVNLHWRLADQPEAEPVRGFTVDVSEGGCFVCAFDPPPNGSLVQLDFLDLKVDGPVVVKVTWALKWREMTRFPGFGCSYLDRKGPTR